MHNQGNKHGPKENARPHDQSEAGRLPEEGGGGIGEPNEDPQPARGGSKGAGHDTRPYQAKRTGFRSRRTFKQATRPGYNDGKI
jgi:hypothetical protein